MINPLKKSSYIDWKSDDWVEAFMWSCKAFFQADQTHFKNIQFLIYENSDASEKVGTNLTVFN